MNFQAERKFRIYNGKRKKKKKKQKGKKEKKSITLRFHVRRYVFIEKTNNADTFSSSYRIGKR